MRTLGNIIWFITFGWIQALACLLLGALLCVTVIGIPLGKSMFQYAHLIAVPFGKQIVRETFIKGSENVSGIRKAGGIIANILWFPFGAIGLIFSVAEAIVCFVTIIFIPVGVALVRSSMFWLTPIGAKVITKEEYQAILTANTIAARNPYMQGNPYTNQYPRYAANTQNTYTASNAYGQSNIYPNQNNYNEQKMYSNLNAPPQSSAYTVTETFCPYCGATISSAAAFCSNCGASLINAN